MTGVSALPAVSAFSRAGAAGGRRSRGGGLAPPPRRRGPRARRWAAPCYGVGGIGHRVEKLEGGLCLASCCRLLARAGAADGRRSRRAAPSYRVIGQPPPMLKNYWEVSGPPAVAALLRARAGAQPVAADLGVAPPPRTPSYGVAGFSGHHVGKINGGLRIITPVAVVKITHHRNKGPAGRDHLFIFENEIPGRGAAWSDLAAGAATIRKRAARARRQVGRPLSAAAASRRHRLCDHLGGGRPAPRPRGLAAATGCGLPRA
jgi:hypothetical protein